MDYYIHIFLKVSNMTRSLGNLTCVDNKIIKRIIHKNSQIVRTAL
jgi:hypothetical protein